MPKEKKMTVEEVKKLLTDLFDQINKNPAVPIYSVVYFKMLIDAEIKKLDELK